MVVIKLWANSFCYCADKYDTVFVSLQSNDLVMIVIAIMRQWLLCSRVNLCLLLLEGTWKIFFFWLVTVR